MNRPQIKKKTSASRQLKWLTDHRCLCTKIWKNAMTSRSMDIDTDRQKIYGNGFQT